MPSILQIKFMNGTGENPWCPPVSCSFWRRLQAWVKATTVALALFVDALAEWQLVPRTNQICLQMQPLIMIAIFNKFPQEYSPRAHVSSVRKSYPFLPADISNLALSLSICLMALPCAIILFFHGFLKFRWKMRWCAGHYHQRQLPFRSAYENTNFLLWKHDSSTKRTLPK